MGGACGGIMSAATTIAAGALMSEAARICPIAAGTIGAEDARVEHHDRSRDARHAARHHDEKLAAGQTREIRPHQQRRFHHADEDVRRGGQPDRAADAHRFFQQQRHRFTSHGSTRQ